MALHPDNMHSGLAKITQYCEFEDMEIIEKADGYFRHFLNMPILLLADDLFELRLSKDNTPNLTKVDSSILVYNYHNPNNEPTMAYIFVVTKKGFPDFINSMLKIEDDIECIMKKTRDNYENI